ncbi:MAG: TadE/TadG family type IV pilus assembly protein [Planctomycetaceae bacterium]
MLRSTAIQCRNSSTHRPAAFQSSRTGAAVVEFAIIIPIFLILVLGIIEFGRAMSVGQMVTNASREGCRQAILDGSSSTAVEAYVDNFLSGALGVTAADVTVTCFVNGAAADVSTAEESDTIRVRVSVPFDRVSLVQADYLAGKTLVGETTMRHE